MKRVSALVNALLPDPTTGIGNPVALRTTHPSCWSRRIIGDHRLVYLVEHDKVVILQARYHHCKWPVALSASAARGSSGSRLHGR
jgi:toxin YoeB